MLEKSEVMKELQYPFDSSLIIRNKRKIRKELLQDCSGPEVHVAILGGSTTHDIKDTLELFLLDNGLRPSFYESEFGQYWQDAMFGNEELSEFHPDIIYIHTSNHNIQKYPSINMSEDIVSDLLEDQFSHFEMMWNKLSDAYNVPIIQNNFEMPYYRLLGNKDASDIHGRTNFLSRLNQKFYEYARTHESFYINDINYLSADYGLKEWSNPLYWHMYKYSLCVPAIPALSFSIANIIKSIYGKNKKALVLDLDNTLWGGVIGDDGVSGIEIGHETSMGQVFSAFQQYLKELKDLGIVLNVDSKNDEENALAGLNHPEGTLKAEDFIVIKANWENKDRNFNEIAKELNILPDSMVFVDDNPVERGIVSAQVPGVAAPEIGNPEDYIGVIDRSGFFEVTNITNDDIKRNDMYRANAQRKKLEQSFPDYHSYLLSLDMKAVIKDFDDVYLSRITELTNKSNQFNLTTKRFTDAEMRCVAASPDYIRLYGKLVDKFGDNGVVTVVIGRKDGTVLHIELWLMSCRVLKRNMENAMMDRLVEECRTCGISKIKGYYYKTVKNGMVKDFYGSMGFRLSEKNGDDSIWELDINNYLPTNKEIMVYNSLEELK